MIGMKFDDISRLFTSDFWVLLMKIVASVGIARRLLVAVCPGSNPGQVISDLLCTKWLHFRLLSYHPTLYSLDISGVVK
jgi:hypothetical protein